MVLTGIQSQVMQKNVYFTRKEFVNISGSLQDYQYAFRGIMATTLEISCCKFPHADSLVEFWRENKEPMLEYLKQANIGENMLFRISRN